MDGLLDGKVAVVTGSGQGIGRCIALCLAENGAKVITNNRKLGSSVHAFEKTQLPFTEEERSELLRFSSDAEDTARTIRENGGEAEAVFCDISSYSGAQHLIHTAVDRWGRIDILINNASSNWTGNICDMGIEEWDTQIASKLSGSFYLMHEALPFMMDQHYGRILNSASDAFNGLSGYAAYGAGNAGVVALTKAAAKDLQGTGITVNAYTPLARTRAWLNARTRYRISGISPDMIECNAPKAMKRTAEGTAEGMVPFLAYLSTEQAGDISGRLFHLAVDGTIGLWSDSQIVRTIRQPEGFWRIEELQTRMPEELLKTVPQNI